MRTLTLGLLAILPALSVAADPQVTGQRLAEAFLNGDVDAVWNQSTPGMQQTFGSRDALAKLQDSLVRDLGTEESVLSQTVVRDGHHDIFTHLSRWSGAETPLQLTIALDDSEQVDGFLVRLQPVAANSPFLDYQTKTDLRLPVRGDWTVYWGGRDIAQNYHAADPGQRFALDLVVVRDGQTHSGDAARLEGYHCWGQPILAPASGTVVAAVDGLPDQPIGQTDPANPAGNHMVIDFGGGEFGFLAHLQHGSLRVAAGQAVSAGQEIGLCGNSGNSSEPHLHFHLQTTPILGEGEGLPAQFQTYIADGKPVDRGEPVQGQVIEARK
jgi:hypothetical protein